MTASPPGNLKLKKGKEAIALIKASAVVQVTDFAGWQLSARNSWPAPSRASNAARCPSLVVLTLPGSSTITASVTSKKAWRRSRPQGRRCRPTAVFKGLLGDGGRAAASRRGPHRPGWFKAGGRRGATIRAARTVAADLIAALRPLAASDNLPPDEAAAAAAARRRRHARRLEFARSSWRDGSARSGASVLCWATLLAQLRERRCRGVLRWRACRPLPARRATYAEAPAACSTRYAAVNALTPPLRTAPAHAPPPAPEGFIERSRSRTWRSARRRGGPVGLRRWSVVVAPEGPGRASRWNWNCAPTWPVRATRLARDAGSGSAARLQQRCSRPSTVLLHDTLDALLAHCGWPTAEQVSSARAGAPTAVRSRRHAAGRQLDHRHRGVQGALAEATVPGAAARADGDRQKRLARGRGAAGACETPSAVESPRCAIVSTGAGTISASKVTVPPPQRNSGRPCAPARRRRPGDQRRRRAAPGKVVV